MQNDNRGYKSKGIWWLPEETEESAVPGELVHSREKGLSLRLRGMLKSFPRIGGRGLLRSVVVHGKLANGARCTVLDAFETSYEPNVQGTEETSLVGKLCLIGSDHVEAQGRHYAKIALSFSYLEELFGLSPFRMVNASSRSASLDPLQKHKYVPKKIEKIHLDKYGAELAFRPSLSESCGRREIRYHYRDLIECEFATLVSIDDCLEVSRRIRNFLSLLACEPIYTRTLTIAKSENGDVTDVLEVLHSEPGVEPLDRIFSHRILHPIYSLEKDIEGLLNKWITLTKEAQPLYQAVMVSLYEPSPYLEVDFLRLVQGLEAFHRGCLGKGAYITPEDFAGCLGKLREALPSTLSAEAKEVFSNKLKYLNEYTLRTRLHELVDTIDANIVNVIVPKELDLISKVVRTRNQLIHQSKTGKGKVFSGRDLYITIIRLQAVAIALILHKLGVSHWLDDASLAKVPRFRQLLNILG